MDILIKFKSLRLEFIFTGITKATHDINKVQLNEWATFTFKWKSDLLSLPMQSAFIG